MALGLSACQAPVPEARTTNPLPVPKPAPTLSQAIARATDLGPANATVDVSGLDSYRRARRYAVQPGGLTASDLLSFYNLKPLRDAGLDGTGQTIVLPEIDDFNVSDLNGFASKFGLPPFGPILTVRRDPSWGTPLKPEGETVLDLEIAHEVAPGAKLVVYMAADDFGHSARAFDAMVTAVGGTTVFEAQQGGYFKEYAWGSPIDESGGGGGASVFYSLPDYQRKEAQSMGRGLRQVPDVAANGDPLTGFRIFFGGRDGQIGGTSASTPLWAGTVALINQDLKQKGLREVGFANPALYWMGENSDKLDPKPFHDVTAGNNLGYRAAPGWDFATGWGSMDGAALDAAWIRYIKSGGG